MHVEVSKIVRCNQGLKWVLSIYFRTIFCRYGSIFNYTYLIQNKKITEKHFSCILLSCYFFSPSIQYIVSILELRPYVFHECAPLQMAKWLCKQLNMAKSIRHRGLDALWGKVLRGLVIHAGLFLFIFKYYL